MLVPGMTLAKLSIFDAVCEPGQITPVRPRKLLCKYQRCATNEVHNANPIRCIATALVSKRDRIPTVGMILKDSL